MKDQMKETKTNTNSETQTLTDLLDEEAESTKGGGSEVFYKSNADYLTSSSNYGRTS